MSNLNQNFLTLGSHARLIKLINASFQRTGDKYLLNG